MTTHVYIYTPNIHTYTSHIHIHTNVSYISQYTFIYTQTPILLQAHTVSTHIPHFIVWSVLSPKAMHKHLCSFLRKSTYPWLFCPAVWVSHGQWKSWMEEHLSDKVYRQQCITNLSLLPWLLHRVIGKGAPWICMQAHPLSACCAL